MDTLTPVATFLGSLAAALALGACAVEPPTAATSATAATSDCGTVSSMRSGVVRITVATFVPLTT